MENTQNLLSDIKSMKTRELEQLSEQIRQDLICNIAKTGGHLGSNLGVVELSVALHHCFNSPVDKIIWDVSHQSYVHKMITGRYDKLSTIRQTDGMSGFSEPEESEHDHHIAGHASTSIASAIGTAKAHGFQYPKEQLPFTIAVIGDGALSSGLALEALNNCKNVKENLIIIVNDNDMSIGKPTGLLSEYLKSVLPADIAYNPHVVDLRNKARSFSRKLPSPVKSMMKTAEQVVRQTIENDVSFSSLGFHTISSVDGHNLSEMISIFKNIKTIQSGENNISPVLIHLKTVKGKGYLPAENAEDKMHGVGGFDIDTGVPDATGKQSTCSTLIGEQVLQHAVANPDTVAVTAAMGKGVGLGNYAKKLPQRLFDVGIAEGYAVTFAAGLAVQKMNTLVFIYSTFLQRAYDSLIHDVSLDSVPVKFFIDRAGFVGADGKTHAGIYDIAYLSNLLNFTVMAPADEKSLFEMTDLVLKWDQGPIAIRYPKGALSDLSKFPELAEHKTVEIGKSQTLRYGKDIAVLSFGHLLPNVLNAAESLQSKHDLDITVVDARFTRPLDTQMLDEIIAEHDTIITIEAGVIGGFGSLVMDYYVNNNLLQGKILQTMTIPHKKAIEHKTTMVEQYKEAGLDSESIVQKILSTLPGAQ